MVRYTEAQIADLLQHQQVINVSTIFFISTITMAPRNIRANFTPKVVRAGYAPYHPPKDLLVLTA